MKHIIVEGCDRTGKDTLIEYIESLSKNNYEQHHFMTPLGNTIEEKIEFQQTDFSIEFERIKIYRTMFKNADDMFVWNRSHIGEYVYGNIYRKYDPSWIFDLEKEYEYDISNDTYLILLIGSPEFLIANEDGHSLSSKLEDRQKEISLFIEAVGKSHIKNKLIIDVTKNETYRPLNEIQKSVKEFLNL
ncbi:MAG: hypothetical protein WC979_01750 [Candidatus Pacearchaeota archaeon]|jgi:thymidylate kinase|nr:hypothetical protein [Clostridia bacterium]